MLSAYRILRHEAAQGARPSGRLNLRSATEAGDQVGKVEALCLEARQQVRLASQQEAQQCCHHAWTHSCLSCLPDGWGCSRNNASLPLERHHQAMPSWNPTAAPSKHLQGRGTHLGWRWCVGSCRPEDGGRLALLLLHHAHMQQVLQHPISIRRSSHHGSAFRAAALPCMFCWDTAGLPSANEVKQ